MFFMISKILAPFTHPLTYVMLLLVFALLFYKKSRFGKTCILIALLFLFVFGTSSVPDIMVRFLETRYNSISPLPHTDAAVVLSGMVNLKASKLNKIEFGEGVERILAGIQLVKNGDAEMLIITGGSGSLYDQTKSEAVFLQKFAIDFGVPPEKILIDPSSRNTYENAVNTKAIMEQHGISTIFLITSAFHIPRAVGCFKKLDIEPLPYPVDYQAIPDPEYHLLDLFPSPEALNRTSFAIHEYLGLLIYKLAGYI